MTLRGEMCNVRVTTSDSSGLGEKSTVARYRKGYRGRVNSMSSPPVCSTCKPGKASIEREAAITKINCDRLYDTVDGCMRAHRGNVADCREEWDAFRACHEGQKRLQRAGKAEGGDGS